MISLKQIGTICFTTILSLFISPSYSYITNASNCDEDVLNTTSAPASLEANYSANRINTKWYSDGTRLTGAGIPGTCTYDNALSLPAAQTKPGYAFGGWRVHVAAAPACTIPSTLVSTDGSSYGYKNDRTGSYGADSDNTSDYNLTEDNTWGVTWSNGDKVTGEAFCSTTDDGKSYAQTGNPGTIGGYAAGGRYCWCRATHYTANNAQQCSLSSPAWVFHRGRGSASDCAAFCAYNCASSVQYGSDFRAAMFGSNVAQ